MLLVAHGKYPVKFRQNSSFSVSHGKLPVAHGKLPVAHGNIPGKKIADFGKIPVRFWYESRIYGYILGLGKIP